MNPKISSGRLERGGGYLNRWFRYNKEELSVRKYNREKYTNSTLGFRLVMGVKGK